MIHIISFRGSLETLYFFITISLFNVTLHAQAPAPPIPVEMLVGHQDLYYQIVVKKPFVSENRLNFFGLATYTANYENRIADNRLITIAQVSYNFKRGFGLMAGTDINSFSGFSPIVGPQHNYTSRRVLAVTVASFFLNDEKDFKIFGLYEFKPLLTDDWSIYSRLQFIYNHNLKEGDHNKSYIYVRAGLKKKSLIFGVGANLDWSGPGKFFDDNYGGFIRWEFK